MSCEGQEKRSRQESSFSRVLDKLSEIQKTAQDVVKTDISICQSTAEDEANTLVFMVDTPDEDKFSELGAKLEEVTGCPDWRIIREKSETPAQLKLMYQYFTLLSTANTDNIQAFVDKVDNNSSLLDLRRNRVN